MFKDAIATMVNNPKASPVAVLILAPWKGGDIFLVERALNSVLAQTTKPQQIIIVEYGSSVLARRIYHTMLSPHQSSVKHCQYPDLSHKSAALQMGLAHVVWTAELVAVLDPEYVWQPTFLQQLADGWLSSAGQCGLIYADETGEDLFGVPVNWSPRLDYDRRRLFESGYIHLSQMALNYRALLAGGGFDNLASGVPDWDISLRLSRHGVRHVSEPLVHHFWWQTENVEPLVQAHYARNIAARIDAGVYGTDGSLRHAEK